MLDMILTNIEDSSIGVSKIKARTYGKEYMILVLGIKSKPDNKLLALPDNSSKDLRDSLYYSLNSLTFFNVSAEIFPESVIWMYSA